MGRALTHSQYSRQRLRQAGLVQHDGHRVVEEAAAGPVEVTSALAVRGAIRHFDLPEWLCHKTLNFPAALNYGD